MGINTSLVSDFTKNIPAFPLSQKSRQVTVPNNQFYPTAGSSSSQAIIK